MMRNPKIGERKSDLICQKCYGELKWKGSIMEGKMVCKNPLCIDCKDIDFKDAFSYASTS